MDTLAHNLFLLMINLSQINRRERVVTLFMEAIEELFPGIGLVFFPPGPPPSPAALELATPRLPLGWFEPAGGGLPVDPKELALLRNAVSMLSVLVENRMQAEQLATRVEAQVMEQRQVETALHESENRFQTMWQVTADAMLLADPAGVVLAANPAFLTMIGLPAEQVIGMPFEQLVPVERQVEFLALYRSLFDGPEHTELELDFVPTTGQPVTVEVRVVFFIHRGQRQALLATLRDISERKQTELRLRQALIEKETLLRELYHRTGNNMQVICSMLSLRGEFSQDAAVQRMCREIETRINSMALVHHKLYQSSSLSEIELDIYIQELCLYMLQAHPGSSARVRMDYDLHPVSVQLDVAIPVGLILSELLSNALQHAFQGERTGQVSITLAGLPDGQLRLTISDNGSGLPPGYDFRRAETIGVQTVVALGEHQLHGQVSFENHPNQGLTCSVRFQRRLYGLRV